MSLQTVVQRACDARDAPDDASIRQWAAAAFEAAAYRAGSDLELTVRLVDEAEATALNRDYRGREYPPNVLSFPMNNDDSIVAPMLGDVVICAAVVAREAGEQNKPPMAHWSHMVVHGVLHCCGYEHDSDPGAERMESIETRVLAEFGFPDPYTWQDEQ